MIAFLKDERKNFASVGEIVQSATSAAAPPPPQQLPGQLALN
jgi:hypothetical protein